MYILYMYTFIYIYILKCYHTYFNMSWMDITLFTTVKVTKCKLRPFEHAQSMSKHLVGFICIGNIINYLLYLLFAFPRVLEIDLEGSSTFPKLRLSMHIDRLGLLSHLYRCLFNCITIQ